MPKILVIDDQEEICRLLSRLLQRFRYEMITAESGIEGLEMLRTNPDTDLLIVDKNMPDLMGTQVIRAARTFKPEIKVILMTAFPDAHFKLAEVDGRLLKPFSSINGVISLVKEILPPESL